MRDRVASEQRPSPQRQSETTRTRPGVAPEQAAVFPAGRSCARCLGEHPAACGSSLLVRSPRSATGIFVFVTRRTDRAPFGARSGIALRAEGGNGCREVRKGEVAMRMWSVALIVCAVACCGCTGSERAKLRQIRSGVARVDRTEPSRSGKIWEPLVPQTEFERDRELLREYQTSLGGRY